MRLAFHPNDPPLPLYRGVEQPFINPAGLQQLLKRYDSPNVGLLFCLGTMQETGEDMPAALRSFGEQGKLFTIHFRNVRAASSRASRKSSRTRATTTRPTRCARCTRSASTAS